MSISCAILLAALNCLCRNVEGLSLLPSYQKSNRGSSLSAGRHRKILIRKLQLVTLPLCCLTLPVFICEANVAFAQEVTATITGTITDQSDAAIAGANVTAKSVDRGTTFVTVTNESGLYRISQLPVGSYDLKVEKQGFQTALHPAFVLVLNQTARIDIELKVGQLSQTFEVTGAAAILKRDSIQVETVVNAATNEGLPLATRNYVQLTLLAPGSVTTNPAGFNNGDNTANGERPYINGNRSQSNNFLLDGMDNNQVSDNLLGYTPAPDAIEEFNLITNNASTEFGNFEGGIVNVTIKSGTNSFHGDIWEFFRNDIFNANSWENKFNGPSQVLPRAAVRWNMFGSTVGGPIIKNKLFFFTDYQGQRFDHPNTLSFITVYTPAEQHGDFSQLLIEQSVQLYNPCAAGTGMNGVACTAPATRQPFVNNQIPISMISPVAAAFFASPLYPKTVNNNLQQNAVNTTSQAYNTDQGDFKIDYLASDKDRISSRFTRAYQNNPSTNSQLVLGNGYETAPIWNVVGNWSHSINPNLVNDVRFGWSNIILAAGSSSDPLLGKYGESIGIQHSNPNGLIGLLGLQMGNILTGLGTANTSQDFDDKVWQFEDGVTWTHGRHNLKMGGQYWHEIINTFYSGNSGALGNMIFQNNFTSSAAIDPTPNSGEGMGDFFLGLPSIFNRGASSGGWTQSDNVFGIYAQDVWRVNPQLTLNIGLRYEAHTPWVETDDHQVNFGLVSGTVMYANQSGNSRALYNGTYGGKDFQPRIGFAWTPEKLGGHTVFRGAFTISSYLEGTGTNLRLTQNPPFSAAEFNTQYFNVPLPATTASDGIIAPPQSTSCADLSCFSNATIRVWDPDVQPAISDQWNLTIQHQFWGDTTLQIGFVGQRGTHLMVPMPYSQKISLPNTSCGVPPCTAPSLYFTGNPTLVAEISQASGTASNGNMTYNALQMVLQKQMSHGLQYQVAYTYSKCMTNDSGYFPAWSQAVSASPYWQNLYDPKAEWAPCYYDSTNVISEYALYELPFGRGKSFGKNMNKVANAVGGGWSVSQIVSWHTGFPLALYGNGDPTGTGSRGVRPDCLSVTHSQGKVPATGTGGYQWFVNSGNFGDPPTGQFGSCPPSLGYLRGPGYINLDLGIQKSFSITERLRVQFRTDFLNTFNHVNPNVPITGIGAVTGLIQTSQSPRNIQFALKIYY